MTRLFKRKVNLIVGEGTRGIDLTGLKIQFDISRDLFGAPDTAEISVWNLSDTTRAAIEERFTAMRLVAGYEGFQRTLYDGPLVNVDRVRDGVDGITTIFGSDGAREITEMVNITVPPGGTSDDAVRKIATQMKVRVGEIQGLPNQPYARGLTISGTAKEVLNRIADDRRANWSVQNGQLNMLEEKATTQPRDVIAVSSATGLIGSPTITEVGVDFDVLLNPDINPGRSVQIRSIGSNTAIGDRRFFRESRTIGEGSYKVRSVVHSGDNFDGDYVSAVKTQDIT